MMLTGCSMTTEPKKISNLSKISTPAPSSLPVTKTVQDQRISGGNYPSEIYSASLPAVDEEALWQDTLKQCAENLQKALSDVKLHFLTGDDIAAQQVYAQKLNAGDTHIIVSQSFLEQAAVSKESFDQSVQLLKELYTQLEEVQKDFGQQGYQARITAAVSENGEPTIWVDQVAPKEDTYQQRFFDLAYKGSVRHYKEKGGRNITEIETPDGTIRFVFTKRLNYRPGKDLARLARISNSGNVKGLIGNLRGQINRAKADKSLDEDEIRLAVAQMKGVINRAQTKLKRLSEEGQLDIRRKNALKRQELEEARALAQELKRRRTLRKSREYGQIRDQFVPLKYQLYANDNRYEAVGNYLSIPSTSLSVESTVADVSAGTMDLSV